MLIKKGHKQSTRQHTPTQPVCPSLCAPADVVPLLPTFLFNFFGLLFFFLLYFSSFLDFLFLIQEHTRSNTENWSSNK